MLNPDFKELLRLFNDHSVEYLVVGGYALSAHGHPRYTGDIDLWIWSDPENSSRVMKALRDFGFGALGLKEVDFQTPQRVIQLGYPPARIDLMTDIDGVVFSECWPRRVEIVMDDLKVPVLSRDDLVTNKQAAGRLQDLADLEKLRLPQKP